MHMHMYLSFVELSPLSAYSIQRQVALLPVPQEGKLLLYLMHAWEDKFTFLRQDYRGSQTGSLGFWLALWSKMYLSVHSSQTSHTDG